jgi:predicted ester cyclase
MSANQNITAFERLIQQVTAYWKTGDDSLLDEGVTPGFVSHMPGMPSDLAGMKQMLPAFRHAFPDMTVMVEDVFAEGDKVVGRVTWKGTHIGALMGIPATGRLVTVTEMHISRVSNGRICERWGNLDMLGLMQQISRSGEWASGQVASEK